MPSFSLVAGVDMVRHLASRDNRRLLDVRDLDEFESLHVRGAECVPLGQILSRASSWPLDTPLTLICQSGMRAAQTAERLVQAGFSRIHVVDGGSKACIEAGVPIERGRRRIPIQRQVLTGAGMIVLCGLGLSFIHPAFELVSWCTACMLVLVGFTGWCPMAAVLAKAPWNRTHPDDTGRNTATCASRGVCG